MAAAKFNTALKNKLYKNEGFREDMYLDTGGTPTIGYGYTKYSLTGKDGIPSWKEYWNADGTPTGKTMTLEEANQIAELVTQEYIDQVNRDIKNENLTEDQYNAIVDLYYRNGRGNVKRSGVIELINDGKIDEAADLIEKGGKNGRLARVGGNVVQEGDNSYNGITNRNKRAANELRPQTTRTAPDLTRRDNSVYSEHYGTDARVTNINGKDYVVVDYGNGQVLQYLIERANSDVDSGSAVVEDTAPTADNVTVTDEDYSITDLQESDEFAEFEPTFINSLQNENLTDEEIRNEIQKEYPDQKIDVVRDGQGNLRVINQRTVQNEQTETGQTNVTQQPNVIDQTIDPPIERVSPIVVSPTNEVEDVEVENREETLEGIAVPAPPSGEYTVPLPTTDGTELTQELQQQVDTSEISELPEAPEGTEEGEVFTVDGKDYELKDGAVVYLGNAQIEEEGEEENVIPSVDEIERRHGPDAKIVDVSGRDKIQYPDENGELQYYDAYDFYSEENLERYALNDSGNLPPPSDLNIGNQTTRQDNTRGPNINPVIVNGESSQQTIDPSFRPNDNTTPLVTTVTNNDVDGDGVPNSFDPDSQTVDIVPNYSNTPTKTTPPATNLTKTFGDLGNVIGDSLGLVNSVRDLINGPDDLIRAALGEQAFKESMKEVIPQELPELSNQFKQHLAQVQNLSKQGFSVAEANKAKQDIDAAYKQGIENTVRGTSGDRAKFLAMSGVLDQARSSALLEFAAKDAELNRANQAAYTNALSFGEEYNLNKSTTEASQQLQLDLEKKRGASEFAKEAFKGLNDRIGPAGNQYLNTLQSFVRDNQNPYSLTLETPGTTTNTGR